MLENPSTSPAHNYPGWVGFTPPPDPCSPCASLRRRWRSLGASTKVPGPGGPCWNEPGKTLGPVQLDPLSTQEKVAKDDKSTKNDGVKYHFYWIPEGLKGLSILRSLWSRKVSIRWSSVNHPENQSWAQCFVTMTLTVYIIYINMCILYIIICIYYIHICIYYTWCWDTFPDICHPSRQGPWRYAKLGSWEFIPASLEGPPGWPTWLETWKCLMYTPNIDNGAPPF
jgi:hypothetical protein